MLAARTPRLAQPPALPRAQAPAALVGALLFSAAAAGPDVLGMMTTTPAEFDAKVPSSASARAADPQAFASNAARQRLA